MDAALVLQGDAGTISEAVATLCLQKPVVFIGRYWAEESPLRDVLGPLSKGTPITSDEWKVGWIEEANVRLGDAPAQPLGNMIAEHMQAVNLDGAENRIGIVLKNSADEALRVLTKFLPELTSHAFPGDLGDQYGELKSKYEAFV